MIIVSLPFPSSELSGHNTGNRYGKGSIIRAHRQLAADAVADALAPVPDEGDIRLHFHFIPPDRRGDRTNYWNRCKPYIDGIADALGINDRRFVPAMSFAEPRKPGRVIVEIG